MFFTFNRLEWEMCLVFVYFLPHLFSSDHRKKGGEIFNFVHYSQVDMQTLGRHVDSISVVFVVCRKQVDMQKIGRHVDSRQACRQQLDMLTVGRHVDSGQTRRQYICSMQNICRQTCRQNYCLTTWTFTIPVTLHKGPNIRIISGTKL